MCDSPEMVLVRGAMLTGPSAVDEKESQCISQALMYTNIFVFIFMLLLYFASDFASCANLS